MFDHINNLKNENSSLKETIQKVQKDLKSSEENNNKLSEIYQQIKTGNLYPKLEQEKSTIDEKL